MLLTYFTYSFIITEVPSLGHPRSQIPQLLCLSTCFPNTSTFVEHQYPSWSKGQYLYVLPRNVNGNTHLRFFDGPPMVLHSVNIYENKMLKPLSSDL